MRFGLVKLALGLGTVLAATTLHAQAPAGAPAGSNGICKDGSYSNAAKKDGACRGHKGVQTWYVASGIPGAATPAAPAPAATRTPAPAMPTPTPAPSTESLPVPTPASTASPSTPRASRSTSTASKTAAPGGGPGLVWVNTGTNVYHCNGDDVYGKTRAGSYMSEADAKSKGARAARGQACANK